MGQKKAQKWTNCTNAVPPPRGTAGKPSPETFSDTKVGTVVLKQQKLIHLLNQLGNLPYIQLQTKMEHITSYKWKNLPTILTAHGLGIRLAKCQHNEIAKVQRQFTVNHYSNIPIHFSHAWTYFSNLIDPWAVFIIFHRKFTAEGMTSRNWKDFKIGDFDMLTWIVLPRIKYQSGLCFYVYTKRHLYLVLGWIVTQKFK